MADKRKRIRPELYWIWSGEVVATGGAIRNSLPFVVIGLSICLTAIIFLIGD